MRTYHVSTMLLYIAYGLIFLLSGDRLTVAHSGAWFTATGPAIQVWGAVFLMAAGCIDWALIEPGRRLAQRVALGAMLFAGTSWGLAGLLVTLRYGLDPTRPVFWAWFTFVSLHVFTQLGKASQTTDPTNAPHPSQPHPSQPHPDTQGPLDPLDTQDTIRRLHALHASLQGLQGLQGLQDQRDHNGPLAS